MVAPEEKLHPGSINLPLAKLPDPFVADPPVAPEQAPEIAKPFFDKFSVPLAEGKYGDLKEFFFENSYYRDMLVTSPDVRTIHSFTQIQQYLSASKRTFKSLALDDKNPAAASLGPFDPVQSVTAITVNLVGETDIANFRGIAKLVQDAADGGRWKIYLLTTLVTAWKGLQEEQVGAHRPFGAELTVKKPVLKPGQLTAGDAPVLIIGTGHCGLNTAVHLATLGVKSLLIDRLPRVGDVWRNRYDVLTTHDIIQGNHMAYMPFPPNFPTYATKDHIGDWLEGYARIMGLEILTSTTFTTPVWDASKKQWSVTISQEGVEQTINPRHIIQSTGWTGEPNIPNFPGMDTFEGPLTHTSSFKNASGSKGKKVVIIGAANSAQDIAVDFVNNGADVTVVQRSSTKILSRGIVQVLLSMAYNDENVSKIDEIDFAGNALPHSINKLFASQGMKLIAPMQALIEDDYRSAGFKLDEGPDGAGVLYLALQGGTGYHIDECNHKYYRSGQIKVKQGQAVAKITESSAVFEDGSSLEADQIVLATGYKNRESLTRGLVGDTMADQLHGFGGFNSEGEWMVEWRQSGCPGFWVTIGNMAMSRFWSRILALQIQAIEGGLYSIW